MNEKYNEMVEKLAMSMYSEITGQELEKEAEEVEPEAQEESSYEDAVVKMAEEIVSSYMEEVGLEKEASEGAQIDLDDFVEKLAGYYEEAQAHKEAAEQAYLEGQLLEDAATALYNEVIGE